MDYQDDKDKWLADWVLGLQLEEACYVQQVLIEAFGVLAFNMPNKTLDRAESCCVNGDCIQINILE